MLRTPAALFAVVLCAALPLTPTTAKDQRATSPFARIDPTVLKAAQAADAALTRGDVTTAEPLVVQAETAATADADRYVAAALRYRLEQAKITARQQAAPNAPIDRTGLARALDALIANPTTPAAARGLFAARRGEIAYNARQYQQAVQLFMQARQLGYTDSNLDLLIVKAKFEGGDVAGGAADLERVIGTGPARGAKTPVEYYRYAFGRANKARLVPQTVSWMNRYLAAYPSSPQTWYEVLVTYGFAQDSTVKLDNQQKIDLLRLLRTSGGLADQYFYLEYARTAQSAGVPQEGQTVLREGLANGKIAAGTAEAKTIQADLTRAIAQQASASSLEAKANAAATGQPAVQAADSYLGAGNWAKAATLYRTALAKGGVDADAVNTRLGVALARAGDKAGALTAFGAVSGSPRKDIASFWTTWLNAQGTMPAA